MLVSNNYTFIKKFIDKDDIFLFDKLQTLNAKQGKSQRKVILFSYFILTL